MCRTVQLLENLLVTRNRLQKLTSLNKKAKPMTNGLGGRKFFLPLIMKDPTVRYSPVGAVFDTCKQSTNQFHSLSLRPKRGQETTSEVQ